jgi:hypothetical protein
VTRLSCQSRQAAHEGAANTQNMNVHAGILGGAKGAEFAGWMH